MSLAAFAGRAGSMVGNMIYPVMFIIHCSSAFWIGSACFVGTCRPPIGELSHCKCSVILLPSLG